MSGLSAESIARKSEAIGKFDTTKREPQDEARALAEEAMLKDLEQQGDLEFQQDWVFRQDAPEKEQELVDDGSHAGSDAETDERDGKPSKSHGEALLTSGQETTSCNSGTDTETDQDDRSRRGRQSPSFKLPVITGGKGRSGFMINSPVHKGRKSVSEESSLRCAHG